MRAANKRAALDLATFSIDSCFPPILFPMHDDLRKSEKDSTLEHSLFAAFNIE